MQEITSGISILLGSAVVSTIITTIFNQYNNRKSNALKYITEERKTWRESIRLIGEKIQGCEFGGTGNKNIEKYLVELELNINSYGRGNTRSVKEDAYIWNEIDEIRKIDNGEHFKRHKELLIYYISLMIKEDWDRSKNEVVGFSQIFVESLTIMFINLGLTCFYLYIGKNTLTTYIVASAKVIIYTTTIYILFKGIQTIADVFSISLSRNMYLFFYSKIMAVFLLVVSIDFPIMLCLMRLLKQKFPDEYLMNGITVLACYVESAKIFWNWFIYNLRKIRLSSQLIYNRERILKESDMKIQKYRVDTEEIYQYIKDNQEHIIRVKRSVSSIKRLLNIYESEVKRNLQKEAKRIMITDVRNNVSEFENDLQAIEKYRKSIGRYYNLGLLNRIPDIKQLFVNLWSKIKSEVVAIKDFLYKKRGKLE